MRIPILILTLFLSWAAYDTNSFKKRREHSLSSAAEISLEENSEEALKQKKVLRRHLDVIPSWHRKKKEIVRSKCNYFSTKPRDVRFSNQRKIRRMFNNM